VNKADFADQKVLYSPGSRCWKIADYGLTSEVSSHDLRSTRRARGTEGYRATELLEEVARYNNKADIWALGCICYQLCTGVKLFSSEFKVHDYSQSGEIKFPVDIASRLAPEKFKLSSALFVAMGNKLLAMQSLAPSKRLAAKTLELHFEQCTQHARFNPLIAVPKARLMAGRSMNAGSNQ
jgi:serine/threonine protein kinase